MDIFEESRAWLRDPTTCMLPAESYEGSFVDARHAPEGPVINGNESTCHCGERIVQQPDGKWTGWPLINQRPEESE